MLVLGLQIQKEMEDIRESTCGRFGGVFRAEVGGVSLSKPEKLGDSFFEVHSPMHLEWES